MLGLVNPGPPHPVPANALNVVKAIMFASISVVPLMRLGELLHLTCDLCVFEFICLVGSALSKMLSILSS